MLASLLPRRSTRAGWGFILFLIYYCARCVSKGRIHYDYARAEGSRSSERMLALLHRCEAVLTSYYLPNPLISNALVQSVLAEFIRPEATGLHFDRELIATKDGGTICLSWASLLPTATTTTTTTWEEGEHDEDHKNETDDDDDPNRPILFILPGTNGDELSGWYLKLASKHALQRGYRVVVYVRRGCGGIPMTNGRPQDYADPLKQQGGDMALAVDTVRARYPHSKMAALGYSLGGNYLANYLGSSQSSPFQCAVCVCSPYDVTGLSYWIEHRYKLVDWALRKAKNKVMLRNRSAIENDPEAVRRGVSVDRVCAAPSFRRQCELDNLAMWGLPGETLNQYLDRASCYNQLARITAPTLFINAKDDPVTHDLFIPHDRLLANSNVVLVTTKTGGHHAYVDASLPFWWGGRRQEEEEDKLPHCDRLALHWIQEALK